VVAGAFLTVVVHDGECTLVSLGPNGGCVPADTPTLKSLEILPWSLRGASYL